MEVKKSSINFDDISDKEIKKILSSCVRDVACYQLLTASIQDCYCRFILNVPDKYLQNIIHICFSIREAYWWYVDFWFDSFRSVLPKLSLRQFGILVFETCPLLKLHFCSEQYDVFMEAWKEHCKRIPLKGAILLNNTLTKVLMVQGWRKHHWMFPRGKVDEFENDTACAIREIKEELGVDISNFIDTRMYIEIEVKDQPVKLFVVPGILESTHFEPRKRKEIGQICWISLADIPCWESLQKNGMNVTPRNKKENRKRHRFWSVKPFVKSLIGWVELILINVRKKITESSPLNALPAVASKSCCHTTNNKSGLPCSKCSSVVEVNSTIKSNSVSKYMNNGQLRHQNICCLFLLSERQPAEAKSNPTPPLVDLNFWYTLPSNVPHSILHRLQHPASYKRRSKSFLPKPQMQSFENKVHVKKQNNIFQEMKSENLYHVENSVIGSSLKKKKITSSKCNQSFIKEKTCQTPNIKKNDVFVTTLPDNKTKVNNSVKKKTLNICYSLNECLSQKETSVTNSFVSANISENQMGLSHILKDETHRKRNNFSLNIEPVINGPTTSHETVSSPILPSKPQALLKPSEKSMCGILTSKTASLSSNSIVKKRLFQPFCIKYPRKIKISALSPMNLLQNAGHSYYCQNYFFKVMNEKPHGIHKHPRDMDNLICNNFHKVYSIPNCSHYKQMLKYSFAAQQTPPFTINSSCHCFAHSLKNLLRHHCDKCSSRLNFAANLNYFLKAPHPVRHPLSSCHTIHLNRRCHKI